MSVWQQLRSKLVESDRKELNTALEKAKGNIPLAKSDLIKFCLELCTKYDLKDLAKSIREYVSTKEIHAASGGESEFYTSTPITSCVRRSLTIISREHWPLCWKPSELYPAENPYFWA